MRRRIQAWAVRRWPLWAADRRLAIRLRHLSRRCGNGPCKCQERIGRWTPRG